jgi:hypothetical protein
VGVEKGETYNGADDDGSGTVALLEILKPFSKKKDGHGPKRSIMFFTRTREWLTWIQILLWKIHFSLLQNTIANINIAHDWPQR